jgi:phosphoglycolate phosphatase
VTVPVALFDLDGTVWDSLPGIIRSLAHALDHLGLPVPDDETLGSNIGPPLMDMLAHFGVPEPRLTEAQAVYRDRYRRLGEFECEVYPGVAELLDHLRAEGWRLATATSKGVEPTRRMLAHFDLERRFDVIAAAPMDARGAHHGKVQVVAEALDRLGGPDPRGTCIVGDRRHDVEAGLAHGLHVIGVTWGYGAPDELTRAGARDLATDLDVLAELLGNFAEATGPP